jgi:hypothetical protein
MLRQLAGDARFELLLRKIGTTTASVLETAASRERLARAV